MIELRWTFARAGSARGPIQSQAVEYVLQYRVKDNFAAHNDEPDWGEWEDVPMPSPFAALGDRNK